MISQLDDKLFQQEKLLDQLNGKIFPIDIENSRNASRMGFNTQAPERYSGALRKMDQTHKLEPIDGLDKSFSFHKNRVAKLPEVQSRENSPKKSSVMIISPKHIDFSNQFSKQ